MTDGTSQGLFIVVAIVIFGIFVALSYTVFGDSESGLTGGLIDITKTALIESSSKLGVKEQIDDFEMSLLTRWRSDIWDYNQDENIVTLSNDANYRGGIRIPETFFEIGETYTITFDMTKLSGTVAGVGGHLYIAEESLVTINGSQVSLWDGNTSGTDTHTWPQTVNYPNDNNTHKISITFTKTREVSDSNVYIQINRNTDNYEELALDYLVEIANLELYRHVN